jgi:cytoskeletal protein RodZ
VAKHKGVGGMNYEKADQWVALISLLILFVVLCIGGAP